MGVVHLARALSLERSRSPAYRIAALLAFVLGLGAARGWVGLTLGDAAPELTPPTVGTYSALLATTLLTLAGFFLMRGNIERDRRTHVDELFAASALSTTRYLLAQFAAHVALLAGLLSLIVIGALAAPAGSRVGDLTALFQILLPVILLALPAIVFVAGMVVVLDGARATSRATGNLIFFIAWLAFLSSSFSASGGDFMGIGTVIASLKERAHLLIPPASNNVALFVDVPRAHRTYDWTGVSWTTSLVLQRILWMGGGLAATLATVPIYRRLGRATERSMAAAAAGARESSAAGWSLSSSNAEKSSGWAIVAAELTLLRRDLRWWHVLAAGVSILAGIASEPGLAMQKVLPLAWLWPAGLLATIGSREFVSGVDQLLATTAGAAARRSVAAWLSGVILMAVCGSGVLIRILLGGHGALVLAFLGGALFVPALSLLLGELTRSRRPFEAIFLLIWYLGPIRGNRALDFAGTRIERGDTLHGGSFGIAAVVMVGLVVVLRIVRRRGSA